MSTVRGEPQWMASAVALAVVPGGSITRLACTRGSPGCCWWRGGPGLPGGGSRRCCSAALGCAMNRTSGGCAGRWPTRGSTSPRPRGAGTRRGEGLLGAAAPWFVLLLVPAYGLMQQAVLQRPLQDQAAVDSRTGLLRYEPWCRMAGEALTC
jgi:hypothetical protein